MEEILEHFTYAHLPTFLQAISKPYCDMAHQLAKDLPKCGQLTIALQKLMESKDAAVRAKLAKPKDL
jgi:hypothetical protein